MLNPESMLHTAPILTSLKSTSGLSTSRSVDPSEYLKSTNPLTPTLDFGILEMWDGFDDLVRDNRKRISFALDCYVEKDFAVLLSDTIIPILEQNNIKMKILEKPQSPLFLGQADNIICDYSHGCSQPIVAGLHCRKLEISCDIAGKLKGTNNTWREELSESYPVISPFLPFASASRPISQNLIDAAKAIQELYNTLVVNNISYGYLLCKSYIYFVRISASDQNRCELRISKAIHYHELQDAFLSFCLEAYLSYTLWVDSPLLYISPECIETPNVNPLSSYEEGIKGRIKWWITQKINKRQYAAYFDWTQNIRNPFQQNEQSWLEFPVHMRVGTILVDNDLVVTSNFFITEKSDSQLWHIASMLQYLNERNLSYVPRSLVFGRLNSYYILAIEAAGNPVVAIDLHNLSVASGMHSALHELHLAGVMLGEMTLSSFLIEYREENGCQKPLIKVIGFKNSKLYRQVPMIARQHEHNNLEHIINNSLSI